MLTFEQAAEKAGKRLPSRVKARPFRSTEDRPKTFPTDKDIVEIASHPDGEIAGYVAWFCRLNALKP